MLFQLENQRDVNFFHSPPSSLMSLTSMTRKIICAAVLLTACFWTTFSNAKITVRCIYKKKFKFFFKEYMQVGTYLVDKVCKL